MKHEATQATVWKCRQTCFSNLVLTTAFVCVVSTVTQQQQQQQQQRR
jgi:hypothetical protein